MNKEFGYTGSEYSNAGEMHQPHAPLNHIAPEINECHDEYWHDSIEYADELRTINASDIDNEKKHHSKDRHKKVIRKMVYAVASAVTVVSLAQVATPSEDESTITDFENALEEIVSPVVTSEPQESLLAAQTIVFSGSGILTAEAVEKEFEKYDLSENFAVIIEDGYTKIEQAAFSSNDTLIAVSIPDSVTIIGEDAFSDCQNLTIDVLDTTGRTIGGHAFRHVTINNIIISETFDCMQSSNHPSLAIANIKNVSFEQGITTIPAYALYNCRGITSIDIPDTVTTIHMCAFTNIEDLSSITLPDSVTSIGESAFGQCENLVIESLSTSGRTIGSFAFRDVTINEVIISETFDCVQNTNYPSLAYANVQEISFEPGITYIPAAALCGCSFFTSVDIPDTVVSIGNSAFERCHSLTNVTLPDSVTSIGNHAFSGCNNLTNINIPDSVTTIGTNAFYGCDNLVIDKLSTAGRTIGSHAFRDATINEVIISETFDGYKNLGLTAFDDTNIGIVSFEPGITMIPGYSLSGCASITDVVIPDTVTSIGKYAFSGCYTLASINIPDSVTSIDDEAFSGCNNLVIERLYTAGRTIGKHAFRDVTINEVIISETFDGYKNLGLTSFDEANIEIISFEPGITMIPSYSLSGCASITDVVIPDTVTSIGKYAFSGCYTLASVSLPNSVITIEEDAFSNCSNLTLHVSSGSAAEAYAQEEDIPYVIN